jgi:rhodanese-related sulfurtransferase
VVHWDQLEKSRAFLLDVRGPSEYRQDHVEGAVNIPLDELRERMGEVPKDREVWAYCAVGQRSYYAARALSQYGYDIKNLSGGFKTFTLKEALQYM